MSEKIYCGSAREIQTQYGKITKLSLSRADVEKISANLNEKGYINLAVMERRDPDKYGNTHFIIVDNYQKEA